MSFYERFIRQAAWVKDLDKIVALAEEEEDEATRFGLGARDALLSPPYTWRAPVSQQRGAPLPCIGPGSSRLFTFDE